MQPLGQLSFNEPSDRFAAGSGTIVPIEIFKTQLFESRQRCRCFYLHTNRTVAFLQASIKNAAGKPAAFLKNCSAVPPRLAARTRKCKAQAYLKDVALHGTLITRFRFGKVADAKIVAGIKTKAVYQTVAGAGSP